MESVRFMIGFNRHSMNQNAVKSTRLVIMGTNAELDRQCEEMPHYTWISAADGERLSDLQSKFSNLMLSYPNTEGIEFEMGGR